jgi:hypothetical protein
MLDQFDEAATLASNGRTAHVAATKNLKGVTREIARVVRVMDARNQQRFRDDGQLLNSWISASTVLGAPRPGVIYPGASPPEPPPVPRSAAVSLPIRRG